MKNTSIPIGSITIKQMYPFDFEEFLIANGFNQIDIDALESKFKKKESLDEAKHNKVMDLFKKYLLAGGLPDTVNTYLKSENSVNIRNIQSEIHEFYADDASKFNDGNKLKIKRIFDMIPSNTAFYRAY